MIIGLAQLDIFRDEDSRLQIEVGKALTIPERLTCLRLIELGADFVLEDAVPISDARCGASNLGNHRVPVLAPHCGAFLHEVQVLRATIHCFIGIHDARLFEG